MLNQPTFNDHDLNQSLYQALIHHLIQTLSFSTQKLLKDCVFGIAPNTMGVQTFFIVTPDRYSADELIADHHNILHAVDTLMTGIGHLAICVAPPCDPTVDRPETDCSQGSSDMSLPQYMMCRIFELPKAS